MNDKNNNLQDVDEGGAQNKVNVVSTVAAGGGTNLIFFRFSFFFKRIKSI